MRALAAAASVAAAGLALALVAAPAAEAHSVLVSSTPAAGSTISELPAEFSVTMNETLLSGAGDAAFALRVVDGDGRYYGDGCLTLVDDTMSTAAAIGPAGDYTLEWQVVSADGHPVSGEIPFSWTGEATADGTSAPAVCHEAAATGDPDDASGHHDDAAGSDIPLGDVVWIVVAVLVVAVAVTIALVATRRRPRA
ncbi:copper resistance protein CopC [Protaetiibacter intestinalis]|uniref:Copper resistance protein CopC n=2 Tax=Protaetiibacter intestinalis TaxID=2419774 RepID=A0A387B6V6_9MICO|nr:copper resistance protein CopC [Protaetiibacter intestinalis]